MYFCLTLWSQQTNLCKRLYIKHIKFFTDLSQPTTKLFEIQEISTTYTKWLTSHDLGEVVHCWACHSKGHWKTRTLFGKFWPFPIHIENIKAYIHMSSQRPPGHLIWLAKLSVPATACGVSMIPYAGMRGGLGVSIGGLCSIEKDMIPSGHLT